MDGDRFFFNQHTSQRGVLVAEGEASVVVALSNGVCVVWPRFDCVEVV